MKDTMTTRTITNFLTMLLALAGCVVAIVLTYEEFHPQADIGCAKLGGDCSKTIKSSYGHLGPIPTSLFGLGMYVTVAGLCFVRNNVLKARRRAESSRAYTDSLPTADFGDAAMPVEGAETSFAARPAEGNLSQVMVPESDGARMPSEGADTNALATLNTALKRLDMGVWAIALSAVAISWWLQNAALYELCSFCPWCFGSAALVTFMFLLSSYDLLIAGRRLDGEQKLLAWVSAFIILCFGFVAAPVVIARIRVCGPHTSALIPPHVDPVNRRDIILAKYLKFKGDPKSKYAVVEFGDYQCSHCKKAMPVMDELLKSPPEGGVRFAYRNFPLPHHSWALQSALATEAAGEQGKFWQMHDLIFQHQDDMDKPGFGRDQFDAWAESLGLNVKRFGKDFDDPKMTERIATDKTTADTTGLSLTPTFYLVTPTQTVRFTGIEDLEKMWHDSKSPYWK